MFNVLKMLLVTVALFSVVSEVYGEEPEGTAVNTVKAAIEEVLDFFPNVSGELYGIEGEKAELKIDGTVTLRKGSRLSVFRKGIPFYHPITNELIGTTEDLAGRVEIVGKKEAGVYTCRLIRGEIKSGDIARITATKINMAFFQDRKADWAISEKFYADLMSSGRFELGEAYTPDYNPVNLSKLAKELGAEVVLLFSTPVKDGFKHINASLFWAEDAQSLTMVDEVIVGGVSRKSIPGDDLIAESLKGLEPWASFRIESGRLLAVGDVDGNGKQDVVISDGRDIRIYSVGDEIQEVWFIKGDAENIHLSLNILDVNGNGKDEIFVTSLKGNSENEAAISDTELNSSSDSGEVSSFVIEYEASVGYRKIIKDIPFFMNVMDGRLLMQHFTRSLIFDGPVAEGSWNGTEYVSSSLLNLPDDANIYGFAFVDFEGDGQTEVMAYDDLGFLTLYASSGSSLWKSDKSFGKSEKTFRKADRKMARSDSRWHVRSRLTVVRTSSGVEVVTVKKQALVNKVPGLGYKDAEVFSLNWDGDEMQEKLIMGKISGSVTDFRLSGTELFVIARGDMLSFVKNAVSGEFIKGSALYYYRLSGK
ncbi:MAG: VCBS repeat-containing protein [Nitrospira sp.]|nr:VCBS repeat-containing protein [bacterium]MBL7049398.1 VCBS repeat-containing protein [Nitrospira sp.]